MHLDAVAFVALSFAVYRASRMLAREDGPFEALAYLRWGLSLGRPDDHWLTKGVKCPACWSFWIGLAAAGAIGLPWWHGLAYSGVATWLWMTEKGRE